MRNAECETWKEMHTRSGDAGQMDPLLRLQTFVDANEVGAGQAVAADEKLQSRGVSAVVEAEGGFGLAKGDEWRPEAEFVEAHPALDGGFGEVVEDAAGEFDKVAVAVQFQDAVLRVQGGGEREEQYQ